MATVIGSLSCIFSFSEQCLWNVIDNGPKVLTYKSNLGLGIVSVFDCGIKKSYLYEKGGKNWVHNASISVNVYLIYNYFFGPNACKNYELSKWKQSIRPYIPAHLQSILAWENNRKVTGIKVRLIYQAL